MIERYSEVNPEVLLAQQEADVTLREAFKRESFAPQGGDRRYQAHATAMYELLAPQGNPEIVETYRFIAEVRNKPFEPASHVVFRNERVSNMMAQECFERDEYLERSLSKDWWRDYMSTLLDKDSPAHEQFLFHMTGREVQSNISQRALAQLLITYFFGKRLGDNPSIAVIGAADGQDQKPLFMKESALLPVFVRPSSRDPDVVCDTQQHEYLINSLVRQVPARLIPRLSVGVDKSYMPEDMERDWDNHRRAWIKTNSIRPDTLAERPEVEAVFDRVAAFTIERIVRVAYDFTEPLAGSSLPGRPQDEKYDLVIFPFSAYQNSAEGVNTMIHHNAMKIVKPLGLIAVLDFVQASAHDRSSLQFISRAPNNVHLLLLDPSDPARGWRTLLSSKDGRFRNLKFSTEWKTIPGAPGASIR